MINPLCFSWNSSYALDMGLSKIRDNTAGSHMPQAEHADENDAEVPEIRRPVWNSLASRLGRRALRLSLELSKTALSGSRWKGASPDRSVERWMRKLTERGTRVLMMNSEGDLSIEEVARHFGPGGERLKRMEGVTAVLIPAADHTLTPAHARAQLISHVARMVRPENAKQAEVDNRSPQLPEVATAPTDTLLS